LISASNTRKIPHMEQEQRFVDVAFRIPETDIDRYRRIHSQVFSQYSEVSARLVDLPLIEEWEKEAQATEELIGAVRLAVNTEGSAKEGFSLLYSRVAETFVRIHHVDLRQIFSEQRFIGHTLTLMEDSLKYYRSLEKPIHYNIGRGGKKFKAYSWSHDHLSPRGIRLLIGEYGLNGRRRRRFREMADSEQVITINQIIDRAVTRVSWNLKDTLGDRISENRLKI